jgi:hypothetical protein
MDIGFYLLDVDSGNEHQSNIISSINDLCSDLPYANIVLFNNQYAKVDINHKYYMLHIKEAKYFDGILFVFDTKSAMLTQTFPSPKKQILYVSKPEWALTSNMPYGFWHNIYMKDNVEIITDNIETFDLMSICWKEPISLMSKINSKGIQDVIRKLQEPK